MDQVKLQSAKVLTPQEERSIDQNIASLTELKDEKEIVQGVNYEAKDVESIDRRIKELQRLKQMHGVPIISPKERERVQKELTLLEDDLRKDMPSWEVYVGLTPKDGARYTSLVRKIVKWESDPVRRQKVQRWKTLRRLLEPEDPTASSTMYLFPQ